MWKGSKSEMCDYIDHSGSYDTKRGAILITDIKKKKEEIIVSRWEKVK